MLQSEEHGWRDCPGPLLTSHQQELAKYGFGLARQSGPEPGWRVTLEVKIIKISKNILHYFMYTVSNYVVIYTFTAGQ